MASRAWERRNEIARSKGYANYYDFRAHGYGKRPPSAPRARGRELRRLRGHTSLADAIEAIGPQTLVLSLGVDRDVSTGQFRRVEILIVGDDGETDRYVLTGRAASQPSLDRLMAAIDAAGADYMAAPSLDIRSPGGLEREPEELDDDLEQDEAA